MQSLNENYKSGGMEISASEANLQRAKKSAKRKKKLFLLELLRHMNIIWYSKLLNCLLT